MDAVLPQNQGRSGFGCPFLLLRQPQCANCQRILATLAQQATYKRTVTTVSIGSDTGRTVNARSRHPIRRRSRRMCGRERVSPPGNRDTWSRVTTIAKLSAAPFTEA